MPPTSCSKLLYTDIDWNDLWCQAREKKSWHTKKASDWDKKASSFAERNIHSAYADLFLSKVPLDESMSVLDVGCGPGTLAIPLGEKACKVTCIDYSPKMLELVKQRAREKNVQTIQTIKCSWEDDWEKKSIKPHDITIASRSMSVSDLRGALRKLDNYAEKFVFITDRISPSPFEPEAFTAIGRNFNAGPDYIFTVNCLYSMDIHPSIRILQLKRDLTFTSIEEAYSAYRWMFHNLTEFEDKKLQEYILSQVIARDNHKITVRRKHPPRWALIWWQKR